jgi:hypothetical protein
MKKNEPFDRVRLGCIEATIWMNETKEGRRWFSVELTRHYQSEDEWRSTKSFDHADLPVAAEALMMAYRKVWKQKAVWRGEKSEGE